MLKTVKQLTCCPIDKELRMLGAGGFVFAEIKSRQHVYRHFLTNVHRILLQTFTPYYVSHSSSTLEFNLYKRSNLLKSICIWKDFPALASIAS